MNDWVVSQLVELFKTTYGVGFDSAEDLLQTEINMLELLVQLGRKAMTGLFAEAGTGYRGTELEKEGVGYRFEGNRE
ncbi:MAG: hypothetical protein P1P84_25680, partial [Deferrisomatales bacterium]|nr:hypothetical protein [Deferrisomatales bacterium]